MHADVYWGSRGVLAAVRQSQCLRCRRNAGGRAVASSAEVAAKEPAVSSASAATPQDMVNMDEVPAKVRSLIDVIWTTRIKDDLGQDE